MHVMYMCTSHDSYWFQHSTLPSFVTSTPQQRWRSQFWIEGGGGGGGGGRETPCSFMV